MKDKIIAELNKITNLDIKHISELIETPLNHALGDYAFPCFILAKKYKKNPSEIALELQSKIKTSKYIEKINASGPYLNFFINKKTLAEDTINKILKEKDKYGSLKLSSEKVMIEFSQANTHKAFHIGHVRGTSLGESIARILEFCGNKVLRANYQGDIGMHVAKWLWCYKKYHSKEKLRKDETWIAGIYVEAIRKLEEKPELQQEVEEINRKLEARTDKNLDTLWKKTRKLSLSSFEKIYKELDTHFNHSFFESELEEKAKLISNALVKKRIAEISEGATIVRLEAYDLGVWVLLRKDGTVLYSAKDIALAEIKFNKYKINKSIYVVGSEQKMHIQQLFKTLELMKFKQAEKCVYIPITEVRLPEGKMSSRTGSNILYSIFKDELVEHAKQEIKNRGKISKKELKKRALIIAIASLKYAMLKQDVNKAIIFNKEEAMQFEGNTGPYLLYTYARARSILRKSKSSKSKYSIPELSNIEKTLILKLSQFSDIINSAYRNLAPNTIANYSYELAQIFNEFYHTEKVIGSEKEAFRLALVQAASQTLKNSLYLLAIPLLERM